MPARSRKTRPVDARTVAERAERPRLGLATAAEVAVYLGRKQQTLANWRWAGKGPRYTGRGRGLRYDWADVDEWLASGPVGGEGSQRGAA